MSVDFLKGFPVIASMSGSAESFLDEIQSALDILDEPVAFDNGDGTSSIEDSTGAAVDNIDNESLDQFLDYARYGTEIQHGSYRNNTDFQVRDGKLFLTDKRKGGK